MGVNVLSSYYLQSTLRTKESLILSLLRNIFLSGICILVLPIFLPANTLWIIMPIVECFVFLLSLPYLLKEYR
ncbi:hypothetical protein [Anaerosporobacter faecicola]|uniref:hypothetical protein n=1 Tax=Anaerosporobacter faecicola TaxID=2718714 RepID=UPI00143BE27C|nr:hypothetical protein [Anaerosporobacter faecicola]